MGSVVSKLDISSVVTMCKERKRFVKAAEDFRYDLVSAYVMYLQSLLDVGNALNQYVEEELLIFPDSPQASVSDYELSEDDSHLKFPSSVSDSDLDSLNDHVHNDMEVPRGPLLKPEVPGNLKPSVTENQEKFTAKKDESLGKKRSYEMPHGIHKQPGVMNKSHQQASSNLSSSHPNHSNQVNIDVPMDSMHADFRQKHNHMFSFGNGLEIPQKDYKHVHHMNQDYCCGYPYHGSVTSSMDKQTGQTTAPPTPPPPQVSSWDSLFSMNYDVFYENYISDSYKIRSSSSDNDFREIREREGIPDLEDEAAQREGIPDLEDEAAQREGVPDLEDEAVQSSTETVFDEMGMERDIGLDSGGGYSNTAKLNSEGALSAECQELEDSGKATQKEMNINAEIFFSKKEPQTKEGRISETAQTIVEECESLGTSSVSTPVACCRMGLREAVKDIREEFENIFSNGKEISMILEVGKLPHHPLCSKFKAFASFVLGLVIPSMVPCSRPPYMVSNQSASRARLFNDKRNSEVLARPESGELSLTLMKLYAWEKKLHAEVMSEEKLRILYDKQSKKLKTLDDKGAEADKIDETMASIRHLHSKINVAVASISGISREIHKLRDNKLLPELNKLIKGLIRLWKFMGTCHQKQLQAIIQAKSHVHIAGPDIRKQSRSRATLRLENVILNWGVCFSNFINTQKAFVKHLNEWLLRCIIQEPEETAEGVALLSPSRTGAPPIFTLCNDWYRAVDTISEMGVSRAIGNFALSLHQLYEKQEEELTKKRSAEYLMKDYEHKLRSFCRMHGISWHKDASFTDMEALGGIADADVPLLGEFDESLTTTRERLVEQRARHSEAIKQVNDAASSFLQEGLSPIFEALNSFYVENLKAYEQLRFPNAECHD